MRLPPESRTPLWRSSRWGGCGCWGNSSRASFMGTSPLPTRAVRRERSSPRLPTVRLEEPSGRRDDRFSATQSERAEGGTHHLDADGIKHAEELKEKAMHPTS